MSEELSYCMSQIVITLFINQLGTRSPCHAHVLLEHPHVCDTVLLLRDSGVATYLVGHLVGAGETEGGVCLRQWFLQVVDAYNPLTCRVVWHLCSTLILRCNLPTIREIVRAGMLIYS